MTKRLHFGVVGGNISYSKSADIFKAALGYLDRSASCDVLSVDRDQVGATLDKVRKGEYAGVSITIPYKSTVIEHLDHLGQSASELGAVNSICMNDGRLTGFNTDIDGFVYPFAPDSKLAQPDSALVLGYGGAARAVVYSLANLLRCKRITICGRSAEKIGQFCSDMASLVGDCELSGITLGEAVPGKFEPCDLVVNCTPLGGWNSPDASPLPDWFDWSVAEMYYDLNYNENNKLVGEAEEAGLTAIDGSAMLVAQALKSLELWTDLDIPFEPVYKAVFARR